MQEMQPSNAVQPAALDASASDDDDYALGWECANPALQIERWGQDDGALDLR